ncbi:MAG: tetratricopeptide repeat protein [Planctomycetota bacterium]|jgi:tetratricopeptide (TPR) repeat protein
MASKRKLTGRKLLLTTIVVLFLGGLGISFYWIYQRGMKREGLFERAQRAFRQERFDDAIRLVNETLASEPENTPARQFLLEALFAAEKWDEAHTFAQRLLEDNPDDEVAALRLCQLALRDGDIARAERLARSLADRKPDFAYQVLALIRDHQGLTTNSWQQRLAASATMRGLVSLIESDGVRAEAFIFAADVSLEVAPFLTQGDGLVKQARKDLEQAAVYAGIARQSSRSYEYDYAMGRIRILSEDEEEAAMGAKMLRKYISGIKRLEPAIAALAKYHLRREEWSDALDLVRDLKDLYFWNRIFWIVRNSDHKEIALEVLARGPVGDGPERALLRADLLLQGSDEAGRTEALADLQKIVRDPEVSTGIVLRALLAIALRVDLRTARTAAEEAKVQDREDYRIAAFLASLLSADEQDKERGLALAQELAQRTESTVESRDVIRLLGGGGAALDHYLDAQVAKGGATGLQHRLHRALTTLARARGDDKDPAETEELRARVLRDLDALKRDPAATKGSLMVAFNLAASLGEAELAGYLLGRAVTMEGAPTSLDVQVLRLSVALEDDEIVAKLADGIRAVAGTASADLYLRAFADAVKSRGGNRAAMVKALEEAAQDEGSRRAALELAGRVALGLGDLAAAERLARAAREAAPESTGALELLGAVLWQRKAYDEIVALYEKREGREEGGAYQLIGALMALQREDEALDIARQMVAGNPRSISAHIVLGRVYLDRQERRKALAVLNMAPSNPYVAHMRAELLRGFGDHDMAERIYQVLLVNSRFTDVQAWHGLKATLADQERSSEFVEFSQRILDSKYLENQPSVRAVVHYLRGLGLEAEGKLHLALADYEAAVRADDRMWYALNNAAWHIARADPTRVGTARAYIDRALQINPKEASLFDTAAEVLAVQGDRDEALKYMEKAIAAYGEGKEPARFVLHKAEILERFDRDEEAQALLQKIRGEHAGTALAKRAREILWKIERKHLPEEKPLDFEMPEDEKDAAEEGAEE